MSASHYRFMRIAGLCGIGTPIVSLTLIFVSVAISPWFSWQANALSDMGISSIPNPFNFGLIVSGLLSIVFAVGLSRWIGPGKLSRTGCAALLIGSAALSLIGIVTEAFGRLHFYIAASYFTLTPLSYCVLGAVLLRKHDRVKGIVTISAGIGVLLLMTLRATITHHAGIAVPEILASMITSSWTFSMGVNLLFEKPLERSGTGE